MKAGIYQTPNKNLIYVAKDRTIKATTLVPSGWVGTKVSEKKGQVVIEGTSYHCDRVGDAPNGCTDPMRALIDKLEELKVKMPNRENDAGEAEDPTDWDAVLSASGNTDKKSDTVATSSHWKSGGPWPGNFYSGGLEPRDGDVLIEFQDDGQDFLRWTLRENDAGYMAVIDSLPYEKYIWEGLLVHNADNLLRGVTDKIHVSRFASAPGFDSFDMNHNVIHASKVIDREAVNKQLFASYGSGMERMSDHQTLCAALAAYGFVYNPATKEFEACAEDYRKFYRARMDGHLADLDDLGPFVVGIKPTAIPPMETEEQRKERDEKHYNRLHATLDRVRQTCGGAPVNPPAMNAIDFAYSAEDTALAALKAGEFRLCHAASARKHKKKRDRHVWFHPVFGCYAWRMIA